MKWYYKYGFSSNQYRGLILVILFIISVIIYQILLDSITPKKSFAFKDFPETTVYKSVVDSLWNFDPNSIAESDFVILGLNKKLAARAVKYRSKGGRFNKASDLLRIYGMDSAWFKKVKPYVTIKHVRRERVNFKEKEVYSITPFDLNKVTAEELVNMGVEGALASRVIKYREARGGFSNIKQLASVYGMDSTLFKKIKEIAVISNTSIIKHNVVVDINSVDSTQLISINGLGPKYSQRIIKYRDRLGGFVRKEQLLEVYGVDSATVNRIANQIKVEGEIIPIYINRDTFKKLLRHPYLNYKQVQSVFNYRESIGYLNNINEMLALEYFTEEDGNKLKDYISFE